MRHNIPYNKGAQAFADRMRDRLPFQSNSMTGSECSYSAGYRRRTGLDDADYIISSYATVIAWHSKSEGWFVPQITYSSTTGRQQNIIREAIRLLGFNYRRGTE
jgi:hypothetical protein